MSSAVIGETIHLSGKGGGYDDMYLFLTGPNLAPGGVRPDSVTSAVVSGTAASFTRAPVRGGVWEYDWDTGRTGGTLDPGTYLVWVVPQPLARYDLGGTSYATINVLLTNPVLTAEISGTESIDGTENTAEDTTQVSDGLSVGDEGMIPNNSDGTEGSPIVLGDTTPLATTAGSFSYPCLCIAGIAVVLLLLMCGTKKPEDKTGRH